MGANQMMGFGLHLRLGFVGNHPIGANTFVRFYCTRPCPSLAAKPNHMPTLKNSKPAAQKFPSPPLQSRRSGISITHFLSFFIFFRAASPILSHLPTQVSSSSPVRQCSQCNSPYYPYKEALFQYYLAPNPHVGPFKYYDLTRLPGVK